MRPHQSYKRVGISTSDPVKIVVLLYEGAIRNLAQAVENIGGDTALVSAKLVRTLEIINYLRTSLDHDKGGEISVNLERLYEYMRDQLSYANIELEDGGREKIIEVMDLLQTLLEGWRGVSGTPAAAQALAPAPVEPAPRPALAPTPSAGEDDAPPPSLGGLSMVG